MKTLKTILTAQFGFITAPQAEELRKDFPNMPVVIRWGCAPRERTTLAALPTHLEAGEKRGDYERGVFIEAGKCDELKSALGIS